MINSCVKETFCIYTIDPKVNSIDPKSNWIKVGYGDIYRPGSSDYFTGFGIDCDVTLWKFDNILKNDCYIIEQDIHKYIKHNNITVGAAGIECYISSKEKIHELIEKYFKEKNLNPDIENTTVVNHRKIYKKNLETKNLTLIDFKKIGNKIICDICGRTCNVDSYECLVIDKEGIEKKIYTGPTCLKNLKQVENSIKFQQWFYDKICDKQHNSVEKFISDYLVDSSKILFLPTNIEINIQTMAFKNVAPLIIRLACYILFIKEQKFNFILTPEILMENKLDIDMINVYHIISDSPYFETDDFDEKQFNIRFIHSGINKITLSKFFCNLRTEPINYSKKLDLASKKLDEKQRICLSSHIPFISGVPGSGKSLIIKYILTATAASDKNKKEEDKKKILVIAPTYASLELIMENKKGHTKFKENRNIKGIVIDSWNDNRKDIEKVDILLVEELYMFNVCKLFKLQQIILKYKPKNLYFFGDIFQLPPIGFQEETRYVLNILHNKSIILTKNHRAKDCPVEVEYLNNNKTDFKDLDAVSKVFNVQKYSEKIIETRLPIQDHIFLCHKNETTANINRICYNIIKKEHCYKCTNTIRIKTYTFCNNCIKKFDWMSGSNVKYDKVKDIEKEDYNEKEIILEKDFEYSNIVMVSKKNGNIKYIKKTRCSDYMFYNGQKMTIESNKHNTYDINANGKKFYMENINNLYLDLMFAITIHKSQGQSKNTITFIIDTDNMGSDMVFTALTRAREPNQILILNKLDKDIINFDHIPYHLNEKNQCETIYKTQKPKDPFSGKRYIDVFKEKQKNPSGCEWIEFMIGKSAKHGNIFKMCQKYEI